VPCKLVPVVDRAIGSGKGKRLREALTYQGLIKVAQYLKNEKFDVIHNHLNSGWQTLLFKDMFTSPILTTTHFMMDGECEKVMYSQFRHMPFVSISDSQRLLLPHLNFVATVHHGLDLRPFDFNPKRGRYLAYLGRMSPGKGPLDAIEIARKTGHKLIMAAKINEFERGYYENEIKPFIDDEQVVFIGEVDMPGKVELLRNALALLNPVHLHESFGLTNIEAMACGTPVIALANGALPEIIQHGKTGFLCTTLDEMVEAVQKVKILDRNDCRSHVEQNFTAQRMASQYVDIYRRIADDTSIQQAVAFANAHNHDFVKLRFIASAGV